MSGVITVIRDRFVPGGSVEGARQLPLGEALAKGWGTDAHFQQASSPRAVRLTGRHILEGASISVGCIAFDVDGPGHKASEEWWAAELVKLAALRASHPDAYVYRTRGGYRVVYLLPEPFEVRGDEDADAWTSTVYLPACDLLAEFGIEADRSCSDLTRLFRLPFVVRFPGEKREALATLGDPHAIGAIGALELPKTAEHPPLVSGRQIDVETRVQGVGVSADNAPPSPRPFFLHRILASRGDVLNARSDGSFVIRCPRRRLHSCGRDGDGATLLYTPKGSGYGFIHCKHDSCNDVSIEQWIQALSETESALTRRVAKIDGAGFRAAPYGGTCVTCGVLADDGGAALPLRYVRAYSDGGARWEALWAAAGVEPPDLTDPKDLHEAVLELRGRLITLEIDNAIDGEDVVRRILPARPPEVA